MSGPSKKVKKLNFFTILSDQLFRLVKFEVEVFGT